MKDQYVKFSLGTIPENGLKVDGRIYPKEILEKAFKNHDGKMIIPRHLKEHIEHPTESISLRSHASPESVPNLFAGINASEFMSETDMILTVKVIKDRHIAPRMSGAQLISWDLCQVIDHEG